MTPIENQLFIYRARVVSIYDGDTVRLDIDYGFGQWGMNKSFRLTGIDAPEVQGEERPLGIISRDWLRAQLLIGTWILIKTEKDRTEKFGRYLATIWLDGVNLNEAMITEGFAKPYEG